MKLDHETGRNPTLKQIREAERVVSLHPAQQKNHPSAVPADHNKLDHINTYGPLPEFYIDKPFTCRVCGKVEIWKAHAQKWYYEEAKRYFSTAVECHDCRKSKNKA